MKWLHFILSHSLFIAFCAVAMVFQTSLLLKLHIDVFVYGFIFFATCCSYNFYWIVSKTVFMPPGNVAGWIKKEKTGLMMFLLSAAGLLFCFYQHPLPAAFLFTAFLLTCLYTLPVLPFRPFYVFRKAGAVKTLLLAFTWAYVTVFIPLQKNYHQLNSTECFVFTRRFLFMLMLCIIFDHRDKAVDKIRGLHSLATVLRPEQLSAVIYLIFAILFTTNFLYAYYAISAAQSVALHVSTLALLAVYFYSLKKRGYLFYYFFVDGMMIFSALATYIAGI
jgi:4-hydroxybenzoate polyprenyltransferase